MSNYTKMIVLGAIGWLTLALFSVAQYYQISLHSCYFGVNWLFCSPDLSVAAKAVDMGLVTIIFLCLALSGYYGWKFFVNPDRVISKNSMILTVAVFFVMAFLVVPFSSTDITFYYHAGAAMHNNINPYTQDWYWSKQYLYPNVGKVANNGFAYGPVVAYIFNAVYDISSGNFEVFVAIWKLLNIFFFAGCGWLVYKYLDLSKDESRRNVFWLFWFLQPLILFEWVAVGHFDGLWLIFLLLAMLLAKQRRWWLVLPCLMIGVWLKFIPIIFIPWFAIKWWQEVNWQNWKKMLGGQIIAIALSAVITILSWGKLWQGPSVFASMAKVSKWACDSTFAALYYDLAPLFKLAVGANYHWYLTRFAHLILIAVVLYFLYPFIRKSVSVIFRRYVLSENEFSLALFVTMFAYIIFWQKSVWPWYLIWIIIFGIVAYLNTKNVYLKNIVIWLSLSSLLYYLVFMINFQITGTDAAGEHWFFNYVVLSIFAYPAYQLFKWRRTEYRVEN